MESIKNKKDEEFGTPLEGPKKKSKFKWVVIFVVIFGLIGGMYLGRGEIAKVVKSVPVLNKIFKEKETDGADTKVEANPEITALNTTIKQLNEQLATAETKKLELEERIKTLEQYESQYNDFLAQKKLWETEVASKNEMEYIKYYEQISPEQADILYKELKRKQVATQEQKQYAKVVADMDEEQAAKAIEKIVSTDPELVKYLFEGMSSERQSAILSAMSEQVAPQVIKLIAPEVDTNK